MVVYGFVSFKQNKNEKPAILEVEKACTSLNSTLTNPVNPGGFFAKLPSEQDLVSIIDTINGSSTQTFETPLEADLSLAAAIEESNYLKTLPEDTRFIIYEYLEEHPQDLMLTTENFEKVRISQEKRKQNLASETISMITECDECREIFIEILESSLSDIEKFNALEGQIKAEIENFELEKEFEIESPISIIKYVKSNQRKELIAKAQIHFADVLIERISFYNTQYHLESDINSLKTIINTIKDSDKSVIQKAHEINKEISLWLEINTEVRSKITSLNFYGDNLSALLPCIFKLENLETLHLENNKLTSIPPGIAKLQNLETLHLENNKLTFIPLNIRQLINLKYLYLSKNKIESISDYLFLELTKLHTLDISFNDLSKLPSSIRSLWGLLYLNLEGNKIKNIPDDFFLNLIITSLKLSNNCLSKLPASLKSLPILDSLTLSENRIEIIPDDFFLNLKNLRVLDLSYNRLRQLPSSIKSLPNLHPDNLQISGNMLEEEQ